MQDGVGVDEEVAAGRIARPDLVFGNGKRGEGAVWRLAGWVEVVVARVVEDGGHGSCDVAPGGACRDACGELDANVLAVEAYGGGDATKSQKGLK